MTSISIWNDKIILRTKEDIPPLLEMHTKYIEKLNGHVLWFSHQNLKRIFHVYGQIPITGGKDKLDALKLMLAEFKSMGQNAQHIKTTPDLPLIDYKVPPLGLFQHRGVVFLSQTKRAPLFADCGCLAGDTEVRFSRALVSRKRTLEQLYESMYCAGGPGREWDPSIQTKIRAFKGEYIGLHPIRDIKRQGVKDVYSVTLEDGKTIKATEDHEFLTERGWVQLRQLEVNSDNVMVDNLTKHQEKAGGKVKPKKNPDKRIAVGQYHPYARKQTSHQGRSCSYLLEIHRAIYEANINGLDYKEFIRRMYSGEGVDTMKFVNPKTHFVHHVNEDHYDNSPENLLLVGKSEHMQIHTKGYKSFEHGIPEYSKVKSIAPAGKCMTYDIVCEDPHRNFAANGMIVHNCGKTFMDLTATESLINSGRINKGKVLVCGKLATLETGWLEDCQNFTNLKAVMVWLSPSTYKRKEKMLKLLEEEADLYITNHETVMALEEELAAKKFEKVVVDESTILKSYHGDHTRTGGKFGKALMNVAAHADWRVVMSGTPAPNGPEDLWGQFKFLDPDGIILEASFQDFRAQYMKKVYFGKYNPAVDSREPPHKWVTPVESIKVIRDFVSPFIYQIKIRDHLKDLPERTVMRRPVPMSMEQHEHYMNMRDKLGTVIDDELVAISVRLAQATKLRQITGGFLIDQQEIPHPIESAGKLDALSDLIEEIGDEKIVIYAQYRWEIKSIFERYKDRGALAVYGENKVEDNLANIKEYIRNPDIKIIVLHPQSAAYGITFVVSHYMIFYSISYSEMENYQCIKRIERAGQKHPMFIYYLISKLAKSVPNTKGKKTVTIDEAIFDALQLKRQNQDDLLDQSSVNRNILNHI